MNFIEAINLIDTNYCRFSKKIRRGAQTCYGSRRNDIVVNGEDSVP